MQSQTVEANKIQIPLYMSCFVHQTWATSGVLHTVHTVSLSQF